jgi:O-antigen/teichoic acid export membrane protein
VTPLESTEEPLRADPLEAGEAGGKVIRGSGLRAVAHVVGLVVGIVSAPLVVRHLGVEDYGRFVLVTSLLFVVTGLTEGGLANVAVREYATSATAERRRLIAALLGLRVVLTMVASVLALAFGLVAGYGGVVVAGIALGCVGMVFNAQWATLNTALVSDLRLQAVAGLEIVRALATTAMFLALVLAGASLLPFYVVAPAVAVLTWALTVAVVRRAVPVLPRWDADRARALLRETALYAGATALGAVYFQIALISTSLLTDDEETGIYGIAFRIVDLANGVPWLLAASVFPVLAHAAAYDAERLRYAVARVTEAALIAGAWFGLSIVLGAQFAIDVVAGDEGQAAVPVLRILGIGITATFVVAAWGFVLLSRRRYGALLRANATAFALAVVLSLVLIPQWGARGAGVVTATLEVTLATLYAVALARELPGLRPGVALAPRLGSALVAAFAAGVPLLLVHPVVATVAGGLAYFAVLWALRAIPPELIDALPGRRPS